MYEVVIQLHTKNKEEKNKPPQAVKRRGELSEVGFKVLLKPVFE